MKALSIRQPWAWLILNAGKDIENRQWSTRVRGRILIHASKGMTYDEYDDAAAFYASVVPDPVATSLPDFKTLERGGIVGAVDIVDCISDVAIQFGTRPVCESQWFVGDYGFVLRNPQILPFKPWRGALGFFEVPDFKQMQEQYGESGQTRAEILAGYEQRDAEVQAAIDSLDQKGK